MGMYVANINIGDRNWKVFDIGTCI